MEQKTTKKPSATYRRARYDFTCIVYSTALCDNIYINTGHNKYDPVSEENIIMQSDEVCAVLQEQDKKRAAHPPQANRSAGTQYLDPRQLSIHQVINARDILDLSMFTF